MIVERRPEGKDWLTLREMSKALGISYSLVQRLLRDLRRQGKVEVFRGKTVKKSGRLNHTTWYRLKGKINARSL